MQSMISSSSVSSAPQEASHNDELFMKQRVLFSENLNVSFYSNHLSLSILNHAHIIIYESFS